MILVAAAVAEFFIKLKFDYGKIIELKNPFAGETYQRLKNDLMTIMLGEKDKLFENEQAPDGTSWEKLSQRRAKTQDKKSKKSAAQIEKLNKIAGNNFKSHKVLHDSGHLQKSLSISGAQGQFNSTAGNEVSLGTSVSYAAIQNFGGTIQIPMTKNGFGMGITIPAHKVTIPARPFMGFGSADESEITEYIEGYVKKVNP